MDKHLFYLSRKGKVIASGYYEDGKFVVFKGSVRHYVKVLPPWMNEQETLEEDMVFSSPSAAGSYCLDSNSCNGWTDWKDANGNTLDSVYRHKIINEKEV